MIVVGLALLVLGALVAGSALALANPRIRARYHLERASSSEVRIEKDALVLSGHAKAFVVSSVAKELLPEVIALAHAESERDVEVCYRLLVFQLVTGGSPRPLHVGPSDRWREMSPESLAALVCSLRSHDADLRRWAAARLPADPRALETIISHYRSVSSVRSECEDIETWLFMFDVQYEGGPNRTGGPWLDIARRAFLPHDNEPLPEPAQVAEGLQRWLDENRSKLPEQIH